MTPLHTGFSTMGRAVKSLCSVITEQLLMKQIFLDVIIDYYINKIIKK